MMHTFAAIDVGSFEVELGIYTLSEKSGICSVDHLKHTIALGKDTYNDGKISYRLVDELCVVLAEFVRVMEGYHVEEYRAYATSAMREAENSRIVLDQIRVRTGIEVKVISNSEQRLLSYKAIAAKDEEFQRAILDGTAIMGVGFGSMQVSLFDKDALVSTQNLPLGVLRLRELLSHVKASTKVLRGITAELVDNELITFRKMYLKDRNINHLICVGEATMMLYYKMAAKRERISAQEFANFNKRLENMTLDQIEETFDVNSEYATMMQPATMIFKRMMELTGAQNLWIPGIVLTDGIAAEYGEDRKILKFNHNFDNDILVTARNMAKRYKCHMSHVQAVETLAVEVFDCMKKHHGLGKRERLLLQIAANLHSCGKFVTMRDASECAYNLIMATEIIGLSHLEREVVANVVRYHSRGFNYNEIRLDPDPSKYSRFASQGDVTLVIAKLTAILRLANAMDRGHKGKLLGCRFKIKEEELVITTEYEGDVTLEQLSIERKTDFFEEIYGVLPVLKQKRRG